MVTKKQKMLGWKMVKPELDSKFTVVKPWAGTCSKGCWFAKGDRCRCKCHKINHGKGLQKRLDDIVEAAEPVLQVSSFQREGIIRNADTING